MIAHDVCVKQLERESVNWHEFFSILETQRPFFTEPTKDGAVLTGAQSYELDTSQTRQRVTRADLGMLKELRSELRSELALAKDKCGGCGGTHVVPSW
jgi:hypothetical protein